MFCALSKLKQMLIGAHSQYVILIKTMEKQRFLVTWVWEMNGEKKSYPPKTIFAIFCVSVCVSLTRKHQPYHHRPNSVLFIQLIWETINEKYKAKNAYRQPTDWIAKEPISYVFVFVSSCQIFRRKKRIQISQRLHWSRPVNVVFYSVLLLLLYYIALHEFAEISFFSSFSSA